MANFLGIPLLMSLQADSLGGVESFEVAHKCDTDLNCCDLAAGAVVRPAYPEGPAIVSSGAQSFALSAGRQAAALPQPPVLADRNDRTGMSFDDDLVAKPRL